jgi:diguanylate cyclase (GGDEF)-like protein/PAS domain S-box-containing protein
MSMADYKNNLTQAPAPGHSADPSTLWPSDGRYRALIAASTALVWRSRTDGFLLEGCGWNEDFDEFARRFAGFGWVEAVHPDDRGGVLSLWDEAVTSGICPPLEYRMLRAEGEYRWVHVRATALRGADGAIQEWVGTVTDIHDQRQAAEALRESEERLRLAVDSAGLGVWDFDFRTGQEWWSGGKRAVLGVADNEPVGLPVLMTLMHPEDLPRFEEALREAKRSGRGELQTEFRIHRASDGAMRWITSTGRTFFDADGTPVRMLGTIRDITERKQALEDLKSSEERFRQVAETSPNGCICIGETGTVTFWNKAAEEQFGYSAAEALGGSVEIIVPERFRSAHRAGVERVAKATDYAGHTVELVAQHRDGHEFPVEISISTWMEGGQRAFGALVRDVSERRAQEERLYRLAHYDHLTGLPNRTLLWARIGEALAAGGPAAVMLLDLDGFKDVNDSMGHQAGDQLLIQAAARLAAAMPEGATVARHGGDEFALCLPGIGDARAAGRIVERLQACFAEPFVVAGRSAFLAASIGIALAPEHGTCPEELMVNSDLALYGAKADGRNTSRLFAPQLRLQTQERHSLEVELRRAFREGELELHYQPQVRLADHAVVGAEALLRWRHPQRGLLMPASFLHVLKKGPLAQPVGEWAIRRACVDAASLRAAGSPIRMAVNLFSQQFRADGLVESVQRALADTGLPPELLELEVTESTILKSNETLFLTLKRLRRLGVHIAFDDYGTGYASLSMLKAFPLTRLKIDKGFVQNIVSSKGDIAIIEAIVQLGRSFDLEVIAEGVETEMQEELLQRLGCPEAQGFLYSRAVPLDGLMRFVAQGVARQTAGLMSA